MKPNFTLSLSFEGIALLYRAAGGWRVVGEVPLTVANLKDELAVLRKTAASLDPGGVRCKLLIPDDQIRYLTIETPGMDDAARRAAAADALDGATPYPVEALAFDISPDGAQTHVAAVARETLDEAEAFAAEHRFHPVSFVAAPKDGAFLGEPYFGPTAEAARLLEPGDTVEPDGVAVVIIGSVEAGAAKEQAPPPEPESTEETARADSLPDPEPQSLPKAPGPLGIAAPDVPAGDAPVPGFSSRRGPPSLGGVARTPTPPAATQTEARVAPPTPPAPPSPQPVPKAPPLAVARPAAAPEPNLDAPPPNAFKTPTPQPKAGAPRHLGLILTAVLLAVLVAIGVWATVYLEDGVAGLFKREEPAPVASAIVPAPEPPAVPPPASEPEPDVERPVLAALDGGLTDEDSAVLDALRRPEPAPEVQREPTPDELAARYAVTGIWPVAPEKPQAPQIVSLEDLYLTSIDPVSLVLDAVALPDVQTERTDEVPGEVRSPMAADVTFDLDADGLVRPTPDGALSPEGVRVFAGRPPLVPPEIDRADRASVGTPDDDADTALAGFRPRVRPDGLAESNERANLGGLTLSELGDFRPNMRPQSVQEEALASASLFPQDTAPVAAIDAAVGEALTTPAAVPANALLNSMRPDARPRNFAAIVERATQPAPQPVQTAAVAPQTVAPQTVAPRIPSSASVAREATVRNAISLRRVNLIGVYGKPTDRRALVRLANGRYQKVQVGDRIDGGRVSAIGDSELRYQKSGRNVVLKMPDS